MAVCTGGGFCVLTNLLVCGDCVFVCISMFCLQLFRFVIVFVFEFVYVLLLEVQAVFVVLV